MEEKFEFPLDESLAIAGKIDRLDIADDDTACVIDYKYSNAQNTKSKLENENLLQAPLYLMAVEQAFGLKAAGMYYIGLKGGIACRLERGGQGNRLARSRARAHASSIVAKIRAGRVEVAASIRDNCRFCDCADVCRIEIRGSRKMRVEAE